MFIEKPLEDFLVNYFNFYGTEDQVSNSAVAEVSSPSISCSGGNEVLLNMASHLCQVGPNEVLEEVALGVAGNIFPLAWPAGPGCGYLSICRKMSPCAQSPHPFSVPRKICNV